jgi:UDP-2,3-diacylglucosamine hydrolase
MLKSLRKPKVIGLIAGNGQYPLIFARKAREKGCRLIAVGVHDETEASLEPLVDRMHWVRATDLRRLLDLLKSEQVTDLVMAGQIKHKKLFSGLRPDEALGLILATVRDRRADTLLKAIAKLLKKEGIRLLDSRTFLEELLPRKGVLTQRRPDPREEEDIRFGFDMAKKVSGLDIGQSIAVKERAVVAVEAMEGTDEMIRRAFNIAGPGVVIVKVSKVRQDARFDVPCIGPNTVKTLSESQSGPMAIEAGKTLILEKDVVLDEANQKQVSIVAV